MAIPNIAVRGSTGLALYQSQTPYDPVSKFPLDVSPTFKFMLFGPNGKHFAWINNSKVVIVKTSDWKTVVELDYPKAAQLAYSSKGTYLVVYEPFMTTPSNPKGSPNVHILKTADGQLVKSLEYRDYKLWTPQWSSDEKICARIKGLKLNNYSISPGNQPINILCFIPAKTGPSNGRLFQYPDFSTIVANKSFFQADRVEIFWNQKGTASLMLTSTDVDKTGASYYGKQGLHLITSKGDTSQVIVNKEGPLYNAAWSPSSNEFCVIYGFMPSKATLYNLKCDAVMEFGTGTFNAIKKMEIPDTTFLQWSPDGQHFVTATTAPRLKVSNGYKIWHYSGALLHEKPWGKDELYQVVWQNYPQGTFKTPNIVYKAVEGIASSQPIASKQVYRPPHARNTDFKPTSLHEDSSLETKNQSKAYLKMKKKREAKRQAKQMQDVEDLSNNKQSAVKTIEEPKDNEKLLRIKKIHSDLKSINRFKTLQSSGKELDNNQMARLKLENGLLAELKQLQFSVVLGWDLSYPEHL
ncbi:eukaryotic translation initiation factor 2A [Aphis craccivora]|uniref:Eukaryotic translation initiation factor 2A n=1 Tax=Aphis craccivora TaxID=307492 RepID=A0A6G0YBM2_APHCR|nr:eukaryotic translation initiation factor 2A [Aphis craccivora]